MQVRIEDIQAFLRTAEVRSFKSAAEDLSITQSALSRRLQKLEASLGAKLFDRTSRVVHLTPVGTDFLPTAKRMLFEFEHSLTEIRDRIEKRAGSVVVASNMTVANTALPECIARFHSEYPGISIRTMEDSTPAIVEAVVTGEADFGIASSSNDRPNIVFEPVITDPVVFVARSDHPLSKKKTVRWGDIEETEFIGMRRTSGTYHLLSTAMAEIGIQSKPQLRVAHATTLLGLIQAGLGVSALPRLAALNRPDLNLVIRKLVNPNLCRTIGIVRREGRSLSPIAISLRDIVCSVLLEYGDPIQKP
ncbi:MAG: LysR family transcriptional regulator [Pseudomonadota bacterium]